MHKHTDKGVKVLKITPFLQKIAKKFAKWNYRY